MSFNGITAGYYPIGYETDETVLNRLISRIVVGEVKKTDGQKYQKVKIIYNFVGEITGHNQINM